MARTLQDVLKRLATDPDCVTEDIDLAAITRADLDKFGETVEDLPGYTFWNASPSVTEALICCLRSRNGLWTLEIDRLLQALAWAGTENAVSLFAKLRESPPEWASLLHIPPEDYADCAGWELTASGGKRQLTLEKCYPLIANEGASDPGPVAILRESKDTCPWCGRHIVNFFEFDLRGDLLNFLPVCGGRLTIATCETCAAFSGGLFMKAGPDGGTSWYPGNERPRIVRERSANEEPWYQASKLRISPQQRLPHRSEDWLKQDLHSQIGGLPGWIGDAAYCKCPQCNKRLMFIAQLAVRDIIHPADGMYYALMCPDCWITAIRYQQT